MPGAAFTLCILLFFSPLVKNAISFKKNTDEIVLSVGLLGSC